MMGWWPHNRDGRHSPEPVDRLPFTLARVPAAIYQSWIVLVLNHISLASFYGTEANGINISASRFFLHRLGKRELGFLVILLFCSKKPPFLLVLEKVCIISSWHSLCFSYNYFHIFATSHQKTCVLRSYIMYIPER